MEPGRTVDLRVLLISPRLGLAKAVSDGQAPGLADLRNHFEVQRLPGADNLAQRPWTPERSPLMSIRHTVCGAQNTLIWWLRSTRGAPLPRTAHSGRRAPWPPLAMASKARPGVLAAACKEMFRCTHRQAARPGQKMVDRYPTGYDICVCSTSSGQLPLSDVT
jgi:hypothetical protein